MAEKTEYFSGKIRGYKFVVKYIENLVIEKICCYFEMMLNKTFTHLYTFGNSIYSRKNSRQTFFHS